MLQAAQRQVFAPVTRCDLYHDRPAGQRRLSGQENTAAAAASQFGEQLEIPERLPRFRKVKSRRRLRQKLVAIEKHLELGAPFWKALKDVRRGGGLPVFAAQTDLF